MTRLASRQGWLLAAGTVLPLALWCLWLLFGHPAPRAALVVSDLALIVAPAAAAMSCWSAARRGGERNHSWRFLGLGCLTWAAGSVAWAFCNLVLDQSAPFPSLADIGYLGYAIPMAIGLCLLPRGRSRSSVRLRGNVDTAVIAASLLFVSWALVLGPIERAPDDAWLHRLDALAYPTVDVVLLALVLSLGARYAITHRVSWSLLTLGLVVETIMDSWYALASLQSSYQPGTIRDVGWVVAFLLIGLSARAPRLGQDLAPMAERAVELIEEAIPYLPMAAAALTVLVIRPTPEEAPVTFWLGCLTVAVAGVRQLTLMVDHSRLTRGLDGLVLSRTAALSDSEQRFRALVANLSDVVLLVDPSEDSRPLRYLSPSVQRMLGLDAAQFTSSRQFTQLVHPDDARRNRATADRLYAGGPPCRWRIRLLHVDGGWRTVEVTGTNLQDDPAVNGVVLVLHDVTERERVTRQLSFQASHDPLTGLPNRRALTDRLVKVLARADRRGDRVGLLLLDLDGFKTVNDTFGHTAGDELLVEVARRLTAGARAGDLFCRLGGDEFAVVLEPAGEVGPDAVELAQVAERILTALREPFQIPACSEQSLQLSASIGIAVREPHGEHGGEEMVRDADLAMYVVKAEGKDGFRIFDHSMRTATLTRMELEDGLRRALRDDELVLHYQPVVDVASGQVHGVEALLRWQHPQRGLVPPSDFIPIAEASGLIVPIGRWVLATACAQLRRWHDAQPTGPRLSMAVNVSPRQLGQKLVDDVQLALATHGLDPADLVLEITESLLTDELPASLTALAAHGVLLSIDDFGTGYSSLHRLKTFPVSELKIDRSFVAGITDGSRGAAMVSSIIAMAHALDLSVVAEGIENPEQLAFLAQHGCERAQGFLLARPATAEHITELLTGQRAICAAPVPRATPDDELAGLLATASATDRQLDQEIRRLLRKLEQLTGFESTYLTRIDWEAQIQEIAYARNTGQLQIEEGARVAWDQTVCRSMLDGGPRASGNVERDYPDSPAAAELGLHSYAGVPIRADSGAILGTLCAASSRQHQLDGRITRVMELFAEMVAGSLDGRWSVPLPAR